jgi:hypothetical protein
MARVAPPRAAMTTDVVKRSQPAAVAARDDHAPALCVDDLSSVWIRRVHLPPDPCPLPIEEDVEIGLKDVWCR